MATPCSTRNPRFLGRWFQDEVIMVAVRGYLTYPLSDPQVCDLLRDRGVSVAARTVMRWVLRYAPELEKRGQGYEKPVALSWQSMRRTLRLAVAGGTCTGLWIRRARAWTPFSGCGSREDVLPPRVEAARKSTLDYAGCKCSLAPGRAGVKGERRDSLSEDARSVLRLLQFNYVVEQDHRRMKRRVNPMLGFKSFENARVVIAGIELAQKISQRPYDLRRWGGTDASHAHLWQRVMAA
jgi:transposase-like protein